MILIEDLTVRFGGVVSLDAVRAELPVGTVGLIGPNGAGKTTLLNVLSGFVRPTAGRVVAFGEDLSGMPAHTRARWGVRRTFQTEQAIGALSVAENVAMVHEHCGSGRRDRRAAVDRALEFAGLTGQRDRPVAGLSAADRPVRRARARSGRTATGRPARRAGRRPARGRDRADARRHP
jgi:branched-chain amino acid transport system ATP-binding protein